MMLNVLFWFRVVIVIVVLVCDGAVIGDSMGGY